MFTLLLRPVRFLAQALVTNDSPRKTAWGFALGMIVGLLPKGNLLAVGLAMLLCAVQVNATAALLAIGLFSSVGWILDGFAHKLGTLVLTWAPIQGAFTWLYEHPLGPLVGFSNTVVMGQLLIGLYLLYPAYALTYMAAAKYQPKVSHYLMRFRVIRWLRGVEIGTAWGLGG